ncbi:MAG: chloride channel protein [Candidatus Altiarchaeia archaeon]
MKNKVKEEIAIFGSVVKWVALASFVGVIVGISTSVFLSLLNLGISLSANQQYYYTLLPVAFFLSAALVKYLAPDAKGHGTEKVIEAVNKYSGRIKARVIPVKLLSTIITIAAGGSAGKEGPAAQIGAGLSSSFADIIRLKEHDHKKLVICGISAGFASVFGTPIAGAIFGVEVLVVGGIMYEVLLPSFVAGIVGYHTAASLGTTFLQQDIIFSQAYGGKFLFEVMLSGVFFGLCSVLLIETIGLGERVSDRLKLWEPMKGVVGGIFLVFLTLLVSAKYLGLGIPQITSALQGEKMMWYDFALKSLYTSITLNFGGSGGIITPIFFIGSTAGNVFAQFMSLDIATFSAIGLVSVLAGAANTPIAASIMAVELFGPEIGPYAALACIISFLMTGHRSVYPSQTLAVRKAESVTVKLGRDIEDACPKTDMKTGEITRSIRKLGRLGKKDRKP